MPARTRYYCQKCGIRLFRGRRELCPCCQYRVWCRLMQHGFVCEELTDKRPPRFQVMSEPSHEYLLVPKTLPVSEYQPGLQTSSPFDREDRGIPPGALFGYSEEEARTYWQWLQKREGY